MSSIRRPGRRRRFAAATAIAATLVLTATACQSDDGSDGRAVQALHEADSARTSASPKELPKDLPTSLKDLEKWRNGEWKNWDRDQWVREASDFVNPYIKDHWKPGRMDKAEDNGKRVPENVESASGASASGPEPRAVEARNVKTPYTRNAAPAGKVFMDTPKGPMVCSGTVVKDPRNPGKSNLVATAGHCVHSGKSGGWLRNIMFVPAYNNRGLPAARSERPAAGRRPVRPVVGEWAQTSDYWIQKGAQSGGGGAQQDFAVLHVASGAARGQVAGGDGRQRP